MPAWPKLPTKLPTKLLPAAIMNCIGGRPDPEERRQEAARLLQQQRFGEAMRACRLGAAATSNPHKRCVRPAAAASRLRLSDQADPCLRMQPRQRSG
jgi:hypothetical protein